MERIAYNDGWGFTEEFTEELLSAEFKGELESVRIPHTVKETPYHYFDENIYQMVSGYRRVIRTEDDWEGKRILLHFSGVAHSAYVYLNGELIGEHHCGYTAFEVELTKKLKAGQDNILVVKVDSRESQNIPPFGFVIDYMTYGGIYREVQLIVKEPIYMDEVFVKPSVDSEEILPGTERYGRSMASVLADYQTDAVLAADLVLNGRVFGDIKKYQNTVFSIDASLKSAEGEVLFEDSYDVEFSDAFTEAGEGEYALSYPVSFESRIEGVRLWDVVRPNLYELELVLRYDALELDTFDTKIGFRHSEFQADGYYLNGRKLKLRGLNRHQSYPYVGYAMPESMQKMDADILRYELGLNAVRTSHYPQSQHFIDRCDEIGLLVFTEMPGWQHIGDEDWKEQACENLREMVVQYRNHPSIMLWGVRINESVDDDAFYQRTNALAHELDSTRPTGGVRYLKKSSLLEDVYTYNDFVHDGTNQGCDPKRKVTPDVEKPYLISEYNGHMYPTKAFDSEEHRLCHALRHANVIESVNRETDIAGAFGWCMFDYNTHKDFGSGDRICYHGVMDMFRNPKLAAYVYAAQQKKEPVLEISASMDIGEHPAGNRGDIYIFTNADSVRMYKNDRFIKEYTHRDSPFPHIKRGPILIDDYIGDMLETEEGMTGHQGKIIKDALNYIASHGMNHLPPQITVKMGEAMALYHMKYEDAYGLYQKYVGNWGGTSTEFKFEAVVNGEVVKTVIKSTMTKLLVEAEADHDILEEKDTYDVAAVRVRVTDEHGNIQPFFNTPLVAEVTGPVELIGPKMIQIAGGMGGTYIRTAKNKKRRGKKAQLLLRLPQAAGEDGTAAIEFTVR